jgi:hypothetical protein
MSEARQACGVLVGLGWLVGLSGLARGTDYTVEAEPWNGIGYLLTTAAEAKVEVEVTQELDLGGLRPGEVVLWLYPKRAFDPAPLLAFIEDGGYLVLADDHGEGAALLSQLGIVRSERGPTSHKEWYQGLEGLPVLVPPEPRAGQEPHFLFFNVKELVANYPSVLLGAGDPVVSFSDPRERLVVEARHRGGALLAIADPSLLLNDMLRRFYGNKQFAANILRLYCDTDREPCRVKLLLPETTIRGVYRRSGGTFGQVPQAFGDAARVVNARISAATEWLGGDLGSGMVAWLGFLVGALLTGSIVAGGRRPARLPRLGVGGPMASPEVLDALGIAAHAGSADFYPLARALTATLPELVRGLDRARRNGEMVGDDPEIQALLLRIQREADSFDGAEPTEVGSERFLSLHQAIQAIGSQLDARKQALRASTLPAP